MRLFQFCFSQLRSLGPNKHTLKGFEIIWLSTGFYVYVECKLACLVKPLLFLSSISLVSFTPRIGLRTKNVLDPEQGRGRRLLKFSYMHHPTKNDVTSGLNWASQLASQSEKMAFRLFKISLCLWTICFVSVYNEDGKIFQAHTFDFLSKNFWKREQFSIVLKENNGDPSVIEWRILHICKTDVAQTFGSCRSWFSDNATCNSL